MYRLYVLCTHVFIQLSALVPTCIILEDETTDVHRYTYIHIYFSIISIEAHCAVYLYVRSYTTYR